MSDELKERVKAAVDLEAWIRGEGIPLTGGPNEYKACCPFHQEKSPSFNVVQKEGGWFFYCHGCEASGDIFEWIMRRRGLDFPQALRVAANSVNISVPEKLYNGPTSPRRSPPAEREKSAFDAEKYRALVLGSKVFKYLTEVRKLDAGLLVDYGVGEATMEDWILKRDSAPLETDRAAYAFAYKWRPEGWPANRVPKFEFVKCVGVERPGGKKVEWRDPKGGKNILFGMASPNVETAHAAGGELVICEGEIDALTWAGYGYAAVSVPGGAKYLGWIDFTWDWLQAFKKIHIAFDEDNAGRLKVVEIVNRLGMSRTDIIRLPCKDFKEQA